jgi:hypothetical protein
LGAEVWKATMSPICVLVDAMMPTGNSSVFTPRQDQAMPHGLILRLSPTTRFFLSRKMTSIGKRMNHIWIDEHGSMSRPVSGFSPARPSSPWLRAANDVAISNSEAMATPLVTLIAAVFGFSGAATVSQNSRDRRHVKGLRTADVTTEDTESTELMQTRVRPELSVTLCTPWFNIRTPLVESDELLDRPELARRHAAVVDAA